MTDVTVKLSSMDRSTDPVNASDLLFVTKTESSDSESFAVSANDLQAFIFKETAYTTVDLGLAATDNNQTFYVYTDSTKYFVNGYVNKSGVANAVLNEDSTVRIFVTNYYFNSLSENNKSDYLVSIETADALRSYEPLYSGQQVILKRVVADGPIYNGIITHDPESTATTDDGYRAIITANKSVWVPDISNGIDVRLLGLLADGSNLGTAIQKGIDGENAIVISDTSTFNIVPKISIPNLGIEYSLDKTITIPSFFTLHFSGTTHLNYTGDSSLDAIVVANTGLTGIADGGMSTSNRSDIQGSNIFECDGGSVMLHGPGSSSSSASGITIGEFGTKFLSVRDLTMKNFRIVGFKYGITMNYQNNYINTFEDFTILSCASGIYYPYPTAAAGNSGEKIIFKNGCFGAFTTAVFYIANNNVQINIVDCSLDYTAKDVFYFDTYSSGALINVTRGWIEGWGGMIVNAPYTPISSSGATWKAKGAVVFKDVFFVPNQYTNAKYSSPSARFMHFRQMCSIPNNAVGVEFVDCHWDIDDKLLSKYWSLAGLGSTGTTDSDGTGGQGNVICRNNAFNIQSGTVNFTSGVNSTGAFLGDYLGGLMGWRYDFKFGSGSITTGSTDTSSRYQLNFTNTAGTNTVTGPSAKDSDGFNALTLTSGNASDTFAFTQTKLFNGNDGALNWFYSAISIMRSTNFAGKIQVYTRIRMLDTEVLTGTVGTDSTVTITSTRNLFDSSSAVSGTVFNVTDKFTNADTLIGTDGTYDDYLAVPTSVRQTSYCDKVEVSIYITGFTGSLKVKLPVLWKQNINSNT